MKFNHSKVVLRALNSYDQISPITGLGIKCILDQMKSESNNRLLKSILKRKSEVSKSLKLRKFRVLKEIINNEPTYREMVAPSPFSALIEAFCFYELSKKNDFDISNSVYSYRMPKQGIRSTRNFEYYYNNYSDMNSKISNLLQKKVGDCVLIIDLKSFYSSINTQIAMIGLEKSLPYSLIKGTFSEFTRGLPIGLDFSHVLAQNFLSSFDCEMKKSYENRYFRYVDDISIVCNMNEKDIVLNNVKKHLPAGVEINLDKNDIINKLNWLDYTEQLNVRKKLDNFSTMIHLYCMFNQHPEVIEKRLLNTGYSIPLKKVIARIETKTFKSYTKVLLDERLSLVSSIFRWSEDEFFNLLLNRKLFHLEEINASLKDLGNNEITKDIKSRFSIQNIKFHISNLFYLLNDDELWSLNYSLPNIDALAYVEDIATALTKSNFNRLLTRGGRGVIIVAELWQARNMKPINLDLSSLDNVTDAVENLVYLNLMDVITFSLESMSQLVDEDSFYLASSILRRDKKFDNASPYVKEVNSIFSSYDREELKSLLMSKFDKDESSDFSAFENGLY